MLESTHEITKLRIVAFYDVFCAELYVLKIGCQWRMFSHYLSNSESFIRILSNGVSNGGVKFLAMMNLACLSKR